jgi:hypothetical protein
MWNPLERKMKEKQLCPFSLLRRPYLSHSLRFLLMLFGHPPFRVTSDVPENAKLLS